MKKSLEEKKLELYNSTMNKIIRIGEFLLNEKVEDEIILYFLYK